MNNVRDVRALDILICARNISAEGAGNTWRCNAIICASNQPGIWRNITFWRSPNDGLVKMNSPRLRIRRLPVFDPCDWLVRIFIRGRVRDAHYYIWLLGLLLRAALCPRQIWYEAHPQCQE